jgi:hypothetical protein
MVHANGRPAHRQFTAFGIVLALSALMVLALRALPPTGQGPATPEFGPSIYDEATAVTVADSRAYVAIGSRIWVYAPGPNGQWVPQGQSSALFDSSVDFSGIITSLALAGGRVYAGFRTTENGAGAIRVYDATDPTQVTPTGLVTSTAMVLNPKDMVVEGSRLYVASEASGLNVLDITNPDHPVPQQTIPPIGSLGVQSVASAGGFVYFVESTTGQPGNALTPVPQLAGFLRIMPAGGTSSVGTVPLSRASRRLFADGSRLYSATANGVEVFSIQNPIAPLALGFLQISGDIIDVAANGGDIFVARRGTQAPLIRAAFFGVAVINADNPAAMVETGGIEMPPVADLDIGDGQLFAAATDGFWQINIESPGEPVVVTRGSDLREWVNDIAVVGNHLYMADQYRGLRIFDVTDPGQATELSSFPCNAEALDVIASTVFLACHESPYLGLHRIDVSNPMSPTQLGRLVISGRVTPVHDVNVYDGLAFISMPIQGLYTVDVSGSLSPTLLSRLSTVREPRLGGIRGVHKVGQYVFVATQRQPGLQVLDVQDPSNPVFVGSLVGGSGASVPMTIGIAPWAEKLLTVSDLDRRLYVVDYATPTTPQVVATYNLVHPPSGGLATSGDHVFITTDDSMGGAHDTMVGSPLSSGLTVLDASIPPTSSPIQGWNGISYGSRVVVSESRAYVSHGDGVSIMDIGDPMAPIVIGAIEVTG